jgi:hypothetical protein
MHDHHQRHAGGLALVHAGHNLDSVGLFTMGDHFRLPRSAAIHFRLNGRQVKVKARWHSVDDHTYRSPV